MEEEQRKAIIRETDKKVRAGKKGREKEGHKEKEEKNSEKIVAVNVLRAKRNSQDTIPRTQT